MIIKTSIFELCRGNYRNLSELAQAMGISVSQVYRVREGKRSINQKFIIGAKKAFPNYRLDDLFYLDSELQSDNMAGTVVTRRYRHIIQQYTKPDLVGVGGQATESGGHLASIRESLLVKGMPDI